MTDRELPERAALAALRAMPQAEPTTDVPETDCGNMQASERESFESSPLGGNPPTPMRNFAAAINNLVAAVSDAVLGTPLRAMPVEPVEAAAWMRHDDPRQVISGLEKRDAVAAGGAFAASVARYDMPLIHQRDATPQTAPVLTEDEMWKLWNAQGSDFMDQKEAIQFARAIERAVLRRAGGGV